MRFSLPHKHRKDFSSLINLSFFVIASVRSFVEVSVLHLIQYNFLGVFVIRDISWLDSNNLRGNNPLLPRSIRSVIVGKSGCGKTTLETLTRTRRIY